MNVDDARLITVDYEYSIDEDRLLNVSGNYQNPGSKIAMHIIIGYRPNHGQVSEIVVDTDGTAYNASTDVGVLGRPPKCMYVGKKLDPKIDKWLPAVITRATEILLGRDVRG